MPTLLCDVTDVCVNSGIEMYDAVLDIAYDADTVTLSLAAHSATLIVKADGGVHLLAPDLPLKISTGQRITLLSGVH